MSPDEWADLCLLAEGLTKLSRTRFVLSADEVAEWYVVLPEAVTYDDAAEGLRRHVRTNEYAPTLSQLIAAAGSVQREREAREADEKRAADRKDAKPLSPELHRAAVQQVLAIFERRAPKVQGKEDFWAAVKRRAGK